MSPAPKFPNSLKQFREAAGLSQPQLAEMADTPVQNVSRIERGERALSKKWADLFAPHLKTTAQDLMFAPGPGRSEPSYHPLDEENPSWRPDGEGFDRAYLRENYSPTIPGAIPELDAKAGAGEGAVGEMIVLQVGKESMTGHKINAEWYIPPVYLHDTVSSARQSVVIPVEGDSMMPNYYPGDRVLVDLQLTEMHVDGVYLISDGDSPPQIKRLQRIPFTSPPRVEIVSDNTAYRRMEVDLGQVVIIGKVAAHVARR